MNRYTLTIGALALTGFVATACSGAGGGTQVPDEPQVPTAPHEGTTSPPPATAPGTSAGGTTDPKKDPAAAGDGAGGEAGQAGQDGDTGRLSAGPHCCYQGKYFNCPDEAACFGGFDIEACLSACGNGADTCFDTCFGKLDQAAPPKGCRSDVKPPPGVDCAAGNINL